MHRHILLTFLLILILPLTTPQLTTPTLPVPPPDAAALLTFKSTSDKLHSLHYSHATSLNYCHWQGVKCQSNRVVRLFLPNSSLLGTLPPLLLPQLRVLLLRNNSLSGPLPSFSSLINLRSLILSSNSFSGSFPDSLISLYKLRVLDLSFNNFSGSLPPDLFRLDRLTSLKLQFNSFYGTIPLLNQSTLELFNVSANNFSGEVNSSRFPPSSFALNPFLCGELIHTQCITHSPFYASTTSFLSPPSSEPVRKHSKKKVLIVLFTVAGLVLLSSFLCLFISTRKKMKDTTDNNNTTTSSAVVEKTYFSTTQEVIRVTLDSESNEMKDKSEEIGGGGGRKREKSGNLVYCEGEGRLYTLEQLMRASAEMLGRGMLGTTYKAKLDNQLIVTVKRLDAMRMSGVNGQMFERHMEVVGGLRHPNLVPVRAFFQAREERLIIFDYQPNGSVFSLIHGSRSTRAKPLHWTSCLKIAEDVAQGLAYIHQASKLIHGNLKASNVLLGADFEACITDYCLATLATSSEPEDLDSARYRGPEARQSGRRATHKSDVYAFGVLLLELLSGKPPSQHPFLAPPDMPDWVKAVRGVDDSFEESQLGMLVEVACACSSTSPEQRPTMWQVLKMIQRIKASVGPDDAIDTSAGYV
ncbi:putative inactive receptor kinase At5g67200 [Silene latifolia]|uniref:putative inactive receptor kinase At5g67200 n=1 Tax=Silene latifolia TaxID=37657 RepID=UPI003D76E45F